MLKWKPESSLTFWLDVTRTRCYRPSQRRLVRRSFLMGSTISNPQLILPTYCKSRLRKPPRKHPRLFSKFLKESERWQRYKYLLSKLKRMLTSNSIFLKKPWLHGVDFYACKSADKTERNYLTWHAKVSQRIQPWTILASMTILQPSFLTTHSLQTTLTIWNMLRDIQSVTCKTLYV